MQQTVINFQVYFAKSEIGHYFCPFFSFPKKSWKKKYAELYNKCPNLLKGKEIPTPILFTPFHISIAGDKPLFDYKYDTI